MMILSEQIEEITAIAATTVINVPQAGTGQVSEISIGGHTLPAAFLWFCANCDTHQGWPHVSTWPGLYSPFGAPSPLEIENRTRRESATWPANLVTFFGTDDGVYCFRFENESDPEIVYVDDWTNPITDGQEEAKLEIHAQDWIQWFSKITSTLNDCG
jgi:hypothetical protein